VTGEALAVTALTLLAMVWALQLWRADLAVPLRYTPMDDTKFYLMLVKGIIDHGTYLTNSSLGAPFGQQLYDYPRGADNLNLLQLRGLALLSSNPALVVNLFYLVTFVLTSASCHLVLRTLGVTAPVAAVISVRFSLLPYHFFRGESHLLLSAYYGVPLAALLVLELLAGTRLFDQRAGPGRRLTRWASRRSLATIVICVVIGSANLYYATFALFAGAVIVALVVGALAVNLAPTIVYRAAHGTDRLLERTAVADETTSEAFSLRLANLVVPQRTTGSPHCAGSPRNTTRRSHPRTARRAMPASA